MKKTIITVAVVGIMFLMGLSVYSLVLQKKDTSQVNPCTQLSNLRKEINSKMENEAIDYIELTKYEVKRTRSMMERVLSKKEKCAVFLTELATLDLFSEKNDSSSLKEVKIKKLSEYVGGKRAIEIIEPSYGADIDDKIVRDKIKSVLPDAIICVDMDNYLNEPKTGVHICRDKPSFESWPNLKEYHGSKWGGCAFLVERNLEETSFKFCATSPLGEIFTCTEKGCVDEKGVNI